MKYKKTIIAILMFLVLAVFLIILFQNRPINFDQVTSVQIMAINYDGETSTLSIGIDDPKKFDDIDHFDKLVKSNKGYNPFQNTARWYITIEYRFENQKPVTHKYSGDKNFDTIRKAVMDMKTNAP